ncbi:type II toxin-antitoxin system RelE/ParE family toxin [Tissierella sp. MB52-C2]|uniref:type II toxin-antitoxin system RelE/ParE family toxin n=1 Tax=Tissierella sp. MB52-C2 TaxID=3070999 RepID=UPI00280AF688|nr:type II toxin-antitoxin system RelE/ParE family toxin [Tissierella sp. MB52-C2]WMM25835.1 type II toxin-antitoxin system RelE/ParE family toxin [Tissierella sp. MB52-C2]
MLKVEYSPLVLEDLERISGYITENWGKNVANRILKKIISDIRRLEQYPLSGVSLDKIIDVRTEYRYLFSEKNYIFYYLEYDKIRIVRVLNEKQDYIHHLFGVSSELDEEYGE